MALDGLLCADVPLRNYSLTLIIHNAAKLLQVQRSHTKLMTNRTECKHSLPVWRNIKTSSCSRCWSWSLSCSIRASSVRCRLCSWSTCCRSKATSGVGLAACWPISRNKSSCSALKQTAPPLQTMYSQGMHNIFTLSSYKQKIKILHEQLGPLHGNSSPFCGTLSQRGLDLIKLASV